MPGPGAIGWTWDLAQDIKGSANNTLKRSALRSIGGAYFETFIMRLAHLTLPSADVARAVAFYRGLGLTLLVVEPGGDGEPTYVRLVFPDGGGTLSLERAEGAVTPDAGSGPVIYIECDDLETRVQALAAAGYRFSGPLETKPWMWREAPLVDPDGHRLCLFSAGSYRLDPPWRLAGAEGAPAPTGDDVEAFATARNRGYAEAPLPSARDQQITAYLDRLAGAEAEARDLAATALGPAYTGTFLAFAERMASLAVRLRDGQPAARGLLAVALVWRSASDVRPAIPVLGLLYDAAARAGADPADLFARAGALAPDDVAPLFREFLSRPDLGDIAQEMGYAPGRDRDGFRYQRFWGSGQVDPEA
jgi:catechol 2,3-dioxygenase-like lactoylglutathione lyase family enzyme